MTSLQLLAALLGVTVSAGFAVILSYLTRRFTAPSPAEVDRAERLATSALETTATADESNHLAEDSPIGAMNLAVEDRSKRPITPIRDRDDEALHILAVYAKDLMEESERIARRAGAASASAVHVELAASHIGILRNRTSVLADIGLAVGSILLGAAISYYVNLVTGGAGTDVSKTWAVAVGGFGLTISVMSGTVKVVRQY